jgi:hypothetical protein
VGLFAVLSWDSTFPERRVFAYGTARPESIYQIASISKTFTGLILAQMVVQGKVRLDEPVRELLPAGTVRKPGGREITLLDLATHRSGLPPMPDNLGRNGIPNPGADYHAADLYAFVAEHGVGRDANPPFVYSNFGFALLGACPRIESKGLRAHVGALALPGSQGGASVIHWARAGRPLMATLFLISRHFSPRCLSVTDSIHLQNIVRRAHQCPFRFHLFESS